jgi:TP901 family phage tail tape measure protein
MSGGTVETDVILDADGQAVFKAFDEVARRVKEIQTSVTAIQTKAREAANGFGGSLQKTLGDFNKTIAALERFQSNVKNINEKLFAGSPQGQMAAQAQAMRQRAQEEERAWQQLEAQKTQLSQKRMTQEAQMWASYDRQVHKDIVEQEQLKERLAIQRWERERAQATQAEREQDRLREQNRVKQLRDTAQLQVTNAKSSELQALRAGASANLTDLRSRRDLGSQEDQRRIEQAIALEKERLKLVESRIAAEQRATDKVANSDARIQAALDIRSGRNAERALATQLDLNAAKIRQTDLEAAIAMQIEKARALSGKALIDAERSLKVDEARLQVTNQRVRALERETAQQTREANRPPPGSGGGGGLFGSSGIAGIFARTAAYGGAAMAIYATLGAIKDGITYSLQFEDAIAKLGAISGATATQQAQLAKTIAEVGEQSRFSTLDLANAATVLAQAGFTQGEIADSLKSISQLATASGTSIAEATDVVTSAIGAFQLQASETSHINDVLASALNRTKLNIQQVALGIQYAGATAHENKISFEELTAVMATMANAGIRSGSTIGTGIRQFLVDLQTPTKALADELKKLHLSMADIDVDQLGLPEVLNRLAAAGFDSAAAYKTLETRAAAAYLVLRNNREEIQQQIIAQNQIGQSAEAAAKGQESLAAEWQRFKNILNESVEGGLKPATNALRDFFKSFNDNASDETLKKFRERLRAAFGNPEELARINQEMLNYQAVKRDVADAEAAHADAIEKTTTAYNQATEAVGKQRTVLSSLDDATARVYVRGKELSSNQTALQAEVATLTTRFQGLSTYLDSTAVSYDNLTAALRNYRLEQLKALGSALQTQAATGRLQGGEFIGQANSITQTNLQNGTFSRLPQNVQGLYRSVIANPNNDILRRQLFDASAKLPADLKHFVDEFSVSLDKGVNALRASQQARGQLDIVGQLSSQKGAALQAEVSALAGKPDAQIKAKIAQYQRAKQGKTTSVIGAYDALIEELEGFIGSGAHPEAPEKKKRSGAGLENRQTRAMDALSLKADEAELRNAIKALLHAGGRASTDADGNIVVAGARTLTTERLKQNVQRVDDSLQAWVDDRTQQVRDQIKQLKLDPNSGRGQEMMNDLQREIDAKREDVHRQIGDLVAKALQKVLEGIEKTTRRAEEVVDHQERMAEARVAALDRQSLNGRVPDYVRANVERQAALAKDDGDRQRIAINDRNLADLTKARDDWAAIVDYLQVVGDLENDDPAIKALQDLNDQITTLKNSNEALKASFGGEALIPQSFGDAWGQAVENWREANKGAGDFATTVKNNLGGALETVQGSMQEFFTNVMSGTMSMKEAFRNMVKQIIGYLIQLIAKLIVVKILQTALGGGPSGGAVIASAQAAEAASGLDLNAGFAKLYGGQVHALSGRYIRDGVPNRDSVNAKIARGEYVTRKWAVDNVGVDFMDRLNNRGVAALKDFGPKVVLPPPAQQKMAVYVMLPEEQPSMGPNDVLVAVANDIYRGGPTKQLIKEVAQGV